MKEGVNIAGSLAVSESPIRFLWVLFVPDTLFLVYYGIYRKSRFFPPNLVLYLVSNVARGWLGMWIIVLFIEGAYRVFEGRIKWSKLILLGCLGFLSLPILYQLKLSIRTAKVASLDAVSYTHLDVYKRQPYRAQTAPQTRARHFRSSPRSRALTRSHLWQPLWPPERLFTPRCPVGDDTSRDSIQRLSLIHI